MTLQVFHVGPLVLSALVGRPDLILFRAHVEAYDGALRFGVVLLGLEIQLAWRTARVPYHSRWWTVGLVLALFVDWFHVDVWCMGFDGEVEP